MIINGYEVSALTTDNSGTAKWGFAKKNGLSFFIKEFLSPVFPYDKSVFSESGAEANQKICAQFEQRKKRLYDALKECDNGGIVPIKDFFRSKSKYYIITDKIESSNTSVSDISKLSLKTKIMICRVIAYNMISIHEKNIAHADIKPDNILIKKTLTGAYTAKIIDFDSSFFEDEPPDRDSFQGDAVYFAPESFLYISEEADSISKKIDIFALGILFCQYLTGDIPKFNKEEYSYLYAAVLDGEQPEIAGDLPDEIKSLLLRMLSKVPEDRPNVKEIFEGFKCDTAPKEKEITLPLEPSPDKPEAVKKELPAPKKGFKTAHSKL